MLTPGEKHVPSDLHPKEPQKTTVTVLFALDRWCARSFGRGGQTHLTREQQISGHESEGKKHKDKDDSELETRVELPMSILLSYGFGFQYVLTDPPQKRVP